VAATRSSAGVARASVSEDTAARQRARVFMRLKRLVSNNAGRKSYVRG
jgi:hypothetical protein